MTSTVDTWIDLGSAICRRIEMDVDLKEEETLVAFVRDDRLILDGLFREKSGAVLFEIRNGEVDHFDAPGSVARYASIDGWFIANYGEPLINVSFREVFAKSSNRRLATIEAEFYGADGVLIARGTPDCFEVLIPQRVRFEAKRPLK